MRNYTVKNETKIYKGKFRSDGCRPALVVLKDIPSWFF